MLARRRLRRAGAAAPVRRRRTRFQPGGRSRAPPRPAGAPCARARPRRRRRRRVCRPRSRHRNMRGAFAPTRRCARTGRRDRRAGGRCEHDRRDARCVRARAEGCRRPRGARADRRSGGRTCDDLNVVCTSDRAHAAFERVLSRKDSGHSAVSAVAFRGGARDSVRPMLHSAAMGRMLKCPAALFALLAVALAVGQFSPDVSAQSADASSFEALRWRLIGPFRAGRVSAGAVDPFGIPTPITSARPAAAFGRAPTPARPGRPIFNLHRHGVHRGARDRAVESAHPLCGHRRGGARRRRLQIDRRRRDVDECGPARDAPHRIDRDRRRQSRRRARRRDRRSHARPGSRRLPHRRRRTHVDEGAVRGRCRRVSVNRGRARCTANLVRDPLPRCRLPRRGARAAVQSGAACAAADGSTALAARRDLHVHRRRRHVEKAGRAGAVVAAHRPPGARRRGEEPRACRARRPARRVVPIGRRRRDVDARDRGPAHPARRRDRGPQSGRTSSTSRRRRSTDRSTAGAPSTRSPARRAATIFSCCR